MSTKSISNKIEKALIKQVTMEANAAQSYLALGSWADVQGYEGIAHFLYAHMEEERQHMKKLVDYINDRDGYCTIEALKAPAVKPKNLQNVFEAILEHEKKNSASIHAIVDLCIKEKDHATYNFLQWFVAEQIEEETLAKRLLDKLNIIGNDKGGLYQFDQDLKEL